MRRLADKPDCRCASPQAQAASFACASFAWLKRPGPAIGCRVRLLLAIRRYPADVRFATVAGTLPQVIVSLLALGMALAFILADRDSPTSRALALFLASAGLAIGIGAQIALPLHREGVVDWWHGVFALPEVLAFIFAYEWVLRVRRTVPVGASTVSRSLRMLWM